MEILYGLNNGLIVVLLFVLILGCNEIAYRYARRRKDSASAGVKSQTNTIQAAILGLLALLLGFSFSMGLQRFDSRSEAVIVEANAIGTAYLRTELVPLPDGAALRQLLAQYLDLRVEAGHVDLTHRATRRVMNERASALHAKLWRRAVAATRSDAPTGRNAPPAMTSGLLLQSFNDMFDAYGSRQAALEKHIPEVVLLLLFGVFAITGAVLGFASGLEGGRPKLATVAISLLIVLVVFLVIDLDRPRRGLIQVNQGSLVELQEAVARGYEE
jgi:hypothetical protein